MTSGGDFRWRKTGTFQWRLTGAVGELARDSETRDSEDRPWVNPAGAGRQNGCLSLETWHPARMSWLRQVRMSRDRIRRTYIYRKPGGSAAKPGWLGQR